MWNREKPREKGRTREKKTSEKEREKKEGENYKTENGGKLEMKEIGKRDKERKGAVATFKMQFNSLILQKFW